MHTGCTGVRKSSFGLALVLLLSFIAPTITAAKFDSYILAPRSRTVFPRSTYNTTGRVADVNRLLAGSPGNDGSATFHDAGVATFDFGLSVEGIVTLNISSVSKPGHQWIGVTFTESYLWISPDASDGTSFSGVDEPLWFLINGPGIYKADPKHRRGAFRYMTLVTNSTGSLGVRSVSTSLTIEPTIADDELRDYAGYFHCESDLLNRVWYGGAWTVQLCQTDPDAGNSLIYAYDYPLEYNPHLGPKGTNLWWNNATVSAGRVVLVDGAKRDRLVWAGDYSVALPTAFYTTGHLEGARNGIDSLFEWQNSSGAIPYNSGPAPIPTWGGFSFTSHLFTLIALHDYWMFTGDEEFLQKHWKGMKRAVEFSLEFVDNTGLQYVTVPEDWLRENFNGHVTEANAMLYFVLNQAQTIAGVLNDASDVSHWRKFAEGIKTAANERLWDEKRGLYRDSLSSTLYPQDGNVWAIKANLTTSKSQVKRISKELHARWGPFGAPAPECWGSTVNPMATGFELEAHYIAGNPEYSVGLMEFMWGHYLLDDPRMTNSTYLERYSQDGSLTYAPVTNHARIDHVHPWSTGPNIALSKYAAGIRLTGPGGKDWQFWPQPGNLTDVQAGFETGRGDFSAHWRSSKTNGHRENWSFCFRAPPGTTGLARLDNVDDIDNICLRRQSHSDGILVQGTNGIGDGDGCVPLHRRFDSGGSYDLDDNRDGMVLRVEVDHVVIDGLKGGIHWCVTNDSK